MADGLNRRDDQPGPEPVRKRLVVLHPCLRSVHAHDAEHNLLLPGPGPTTRRRHRLPYHLHLAARRRHDLVLKRSADDGHVGQGQQRRKDRTRRRPGPWHPARAGAHGHRLLDHGTAPGRGQGDGGGEAAAVPPGESGGGPAAELLCDASASCSGSLSGAACH